MALPQNQTWFTFISQFLSHSLNIILYGCHSPACTHFPHAFLMVFFQWFCSWMDDRLILHTYSFLSYYNIPIAWHLCLQNDTKPTSQLWMASMASRLLPWRSWKWMISRAALTSAISLVCPGPHSLNMSCSSRLYLLMRCTGFRRYDHRSILSPSLSCFCWWRMRWNRAVNEPVL